MVHLVKTEARQRCTAGEKRCGHPRLVKKSKTRAIKSFWSVLSGLRLPSGKLSDFFFHTWPTLGTSWVCMHPSAKMDLEVKVVGRNMTLWSGVIPWLLTDREPFCTCVVPPMSWKWGEERSLNPSVKQDFTPLCPWHDYYLDSHRDYYLKVFTSDEHLLLPCFCIHFEGQTGGWL